MSSSGCSFSVSLLSRSQPVLWLLSEELIEEAKPHLYTYHSLTSMCQAFEVQSFYFVEEEIGVQRGHTTWKVDNRFSNLGF